MLAQKTKQNKISKEILAAIANDAVVLYDCCVHTLSCVEGEYDDLYYHFDRREDNSLQGMCNVASNLCYDYFAPIFGKENVKVCPAHCHDLEFFDAGHYFCLLFNRYILDITAGQFWYDDDSAMKKPSSKFLVEKENNIVFTHKRNAAKMPHIYKRALFSLKSVHGVEGCDYNYAFCISSFYEDLLNRFSTLKFQSELILAKEHESIPA